METTGKIEKQAPRELNRATLYEFFEEGQRPTGNDFKDLIYSTINKLDDGISKSFKDGLKLAPQGKEGGRLISFYKQLDGSDPLWIMSLKGKNFLISSLDTKDEPLNLLTLTQDGKVGILNETPAFTLDTKGTVAMESRIGRFINPNNPSDRFDYNSNSVPADGQWHTIADGLSGSNMFEIVALAKSSKANRSHSFLYAIVSNTVNTAGRYHKFRRNHFQWWKWWKRIGLRWEGDNKTYSLKLKTHSNYGREARIYFHITRLWNDFDSFLDQRKEKVENSEESNKP